jgi:hypothetical protein
MIGSLFALLTASSYALSFIFIRRAVLKISDASLGTLITIPMGVPFYFSSSSLRVNCRAL